MNDVKLNLQKEEIRKNFHNLKNNKASQNSDIPSKIIKSNSDIFGHFLYVNINSLIKSSLFPSCLKTVDITTIYNKGKRDVKDSYSAVSILPVLPKLYKRSMFKQISEFYENIFSKNQCGFWKGTQQCLVAVLEKWKRSYYGSKAFGAPLTEQNRVNQLTTLERTFIKNPEFSSSLSTLVFLVVNNYVNNYMY